jgi:hypothetical protein
MMRRVLALAPNLGLVLYLYMPVSRHFLFYSIVYFLGV